MPKIPKSHSNTQMDIIVLIHASCHRNENTNLKNSCRYSWCPKIVNTVRNIDLEVPRKNLKQMLKHKTFIVEGSFSHSFKPLCT